MCNFSPAIDLSVDAMDISGEHQLDVDHNIFKKRLRQDGSPIPAGPTKQERMLFFITHAQSE
jgi:hypothetical protein